MSWPMVLQRFGASAAVVLTLVQPVVAADPPAPEAILVKRPLRDALADATAQNKLLLVCIAGNSDRERRALADLSPAPVRRWAARHALGVLVTDQPTIKTLTDADLNPGPDADPLVFQGGLQVRVFASGLPQKRSRLRGPVGAGKPAESYLGLAFKLDWTLRGKDDPPAAPAPESAGQPGTPLYSVSDAGALAPADSGAAGPGDILAKLEQARASVRAGGAEGLRAATGLYTWLWEAADARDPRFRTARWLAVAPDIAELILKHPPARARFEALRRAMLSRLDIRDHAAVFDLLLLSRALGDHEENLAFLDSALNDPDAQAMMPTLERAAWELLLPACHWLPAGAADPADRLKRQDATAERVLAHVDAAHKDAARAVHQMVRTLEMARAYSTCLARGKDDPARTFLAAAGDARPAMVLAALASGQKRPEQADALSDVPSAADIAKLIKP